MNDGDHSSSRKDVRSRLTFGGSFDLPLRVVSFQKGHGQGEGNYDDGEQRSRLMRVNCRGR